MRREGWSVLISTWSPLAVSFKKRSPSLYPCRSDHPSACPSRSDHPPCTLPEAITPRCILPEAITPHYTIAEAIILPCILREAITPPCNLQYVFRSDHPSLYPSSSDHPDHPSNMTIDLLKISRPRCFWRKSDHPSFHATAPDRLFHKSSDHPDHPSLIRHHSRTLDLTVCQISAITHPNSTPGGANPGLVTPWYQIRKFALGPFFGIQMWP